jgi:uncharacterized protein (DUF362 family)
MPVAWLAARYAYPWLARSPIFRSPTPVQRHPPYALPGPYPGQVVEVRHPRVVSADHRIDARVVSHMIDRGMAELTGTEPCDVKAAWGTFVSPGQVVGIKVNPVGRKPMPDEPGRNPRAAASISSPAVLVKVIRCLQEVGIRSKDIIVFDRYADDFCKAGYADLVERELPGVRWMVSAAAYSDDQLEIAGFDQPRSAFSAELVRHVAGYDPDIFTSMGFSAPEHSPRDDRRFRSHLSLIVARMVDRVINLPVLKDHRSAGVTLALKNLSHGMNNNVARSHLGLQAHGLAAPAMRSTGPNQCNTFIPQAVSQPALRRKVALNILDGLVGVYEGGPGSWNRSWSTWRRQSIFFASDPVALDHVGWSIIDSKRAEMGWPAVEKMGYVQHAEESVTIASELAPLAGQGLLEATTLAALAGTVQAARASETFNLRQPEHIVLAGVLGLGKFPREQIRYRSISLC